MHASHACRARADVKHGTSRRGDARRGDAQAGPPRIAEKAGTAPARGDSTRRARLEVGAAEGRKADAVHEASALDGREPRLALVLAHALVALHDRLGHALGPMGVATAAHSVVRSSVPELAPAQEPPAPSERGGGAQRPARPPARVHAPPNHAHSPGMRAPRQPLSRGRLHAHCELRAGLLPAGSHSQHAC